MKVGIISDTHGYLDPRVHDVFSGVGAIVHAGDIGNPGILMELETIAPVYAVLGNCDFFEYGAQVVARTMPRLGGRRFLIVHKQREIGSIDDDVRVVVTGHTHRSEIRHENGRLFVNPGSASEPRDGTPSVAIVSLKDDGTEDARIVRL